MNWIDRLISFFAPSVGYRRVAARNALSMVRGYEGAMGGRRGKGFKASNVDADTEIAASLSILRARSRKLVRDTPYAERAVRTIVSNVVGTGILSRLDNEALNQRWRDYCSSRRVDYFRMLDFYGIQALAMRSVVEAGEVLIRRRKSVDKDFHTQVEVLEPDFLDTTKSDLTANIRDGIEFDTRGKIVAYHLFKTHPGARATLRNTTWESVRIPASEIIHLFRMDRPGQHRGVPWIAPVLMRMRDYDDYEEAQVMRQKIAACFVGFLKTSEDPITQPSEQERKPMSEKFSPGQWEVLPPGMDITFGTPPGVGSDYESYVRRMLTSLASGFGISYEALTGDLSQVNFSSGRMGWIEMSRNIEVWRHQLLIPGLCDGILDWWLEGERIVGNISVPARVGRVWTPPRREMIDPVKEGQALKDSIRAGLTTYSDALRQLGNDPDDHLKELESDFKKFEDKKLVLDCDPRNDLKLNSPGGNFEPNQESAT